MKKLKTFLKRAAIGIVVLLLILVGFLMYRNVESYKNVIHKDADAIVKIRVDAIGRAIAWDALKKPSYYYQKQKDNDSIDDEDTLGKGFEIPANIFLYTLKGKSATTMFTSFKISDGNDFREFLKSNLKVEDSYKINTIQVAKNKDGKVMVAYTDKQCVVVYNPKKESVDSVFEDILIKDNTLKSDDKLLSKVKDATSHLSYVSSDDLVSIHFMKGKANIEGYISMSEDITFPSQSLYPEFSEESSLKFYMNAISSKKNETIKFNDFEIETDSINNHYKGNFSMEIANATTQNDTVVTYEYNDDFEKVETRVASEKQVPEITFLISADIKRMLQYLRNVSIVENNMLNRELFPLYQVKIDSTSIGLRGSTNLNKPINMQTVSHDDVFGLDINFEKLRRQNHFPILNPYFEKLLILSVKGIKDSSKKTTIDGQLELKNEEILAISQLLF